MSSKKWEQQLFYCPKQAHRVSGIDCDSYYEKEMGCEKNCELREKYLNESISDEKEVPPGVIDTESKTPEAAVEKKCVVCEKNLSIDDFQRNPHTHDGRLKTCKKCMKKKCAAGAAAKKKKEAKKAPEDLSIEKKTSSNKLLPEDREATVFWTENSGELLRAEPIKTGLCIDFTDHPDILKNLETAAREHFRNPDQEVLYLLNQCFEAAERAAG